MKIIPPPQLATRVAAILVLVGVLTTSNVFSQARLVKDINTSEYQHFNEYSQLTNAQRLFYFVSHGKELWKSDGTTAGTVQVKTLRGIQNLTLIGNTLYFAGKDENGLEPWKSDGTAEGTVRVKDVRPGINGSTPKQFISLNETIFFVANDGRGEELWKTDGTSTGTVLVKDIRAGTSGSKPLYLTVMNNMLFFSANDGKHGRELWSTDGSAAGTAIVKNIETRTGKSSEPQELVTLNGFLYFSAHQSVSGRELWKSDGTAKGTAQLKDINAGTASSGITSIRRMGNNIYFNANNGATGTALWRSSGTIAGTTMVKDLAGDNSEFRIHDMTMLHSRLYWVVEVYPIPDYDVPRYDVWVSDGRSAGTRLVTTFESRHTPARFTFTNNKVFYFCGFFNDDEAVDDIYGPFQQLCSINPDGSGWREIWKMHKPFAVGDEGHYHYSLEMIAFDNATIFPGVRHHGEGYKLLKSNGPDTEASVLIDTYKPTQSSSPNAMVKSNSGVYFVALNNPGNNEQLWHTDGTDKGTVLLKSNYRIISPVTVHNTAYFVMWGDGVGYQLWKTDGTPAGTTFVKDLDDYPRLLDVAGTLFFYNDAGEVWRSDGTSSGTVLLNKFAGIEHAVTSGSVAYIMVITASGGQELWKGNGISGEMLKVKTIRSFAGPRSSNYVMTATLGNIFYFVAHDGTHGHEMWRTDGTDAGTYLVNDIRTGDNDEWGSDIWLVTAFKDAIYINARNVAGDLSLFKSDGTNGGTKEIYDSDVIRQFIPYNDQLLFISPDANMQRLFSTNGTTAGTMMLKDLPSNDDWSISHVQMDDILYFSFSDRDLWRTDGTACGTMAIGVGVTKVDNLIPARDNLILFSGHHNFYGEELFSINANALPVPSCPEVFSARQETSTAKEESDDGRVIYTPNPFDHDFTVVINSDRQSTAEMVVHDMAGQALTSEVLETNTTYRLGSNWHEGIYIMRIYVDGKETYMRVIKRGP